MAAPADFFELSAIAFMAPLALSAMAPMDFLALSAMAFMAPFALSAMAPMAPFALSIDAAAAAAVESPAGFFSPPQAVSAAIAIRAVKTEVERRIGKSGQGFVKKGQ